MKIVMTGPPGSGKGTQGKLLSKEFSIPHISIGRLLRGLAEKDTEEGRSINQIIDSGKLVPTEFVIEEVAKRIQADDCRPGYILDGVRRMEEAESLHERIGFDRFVHINISEEETHARLGTRTTCKACGEVYGPAHVPKTPNQCDSCQGALSKRDDDTYEVIQQRLAIFKEEGQPILDYADSLGILSVVNGEQSLDVDENVNAVFMDIKSIWELKT